MYFVILSERLQGHSRFETISAYLYETKGREKAVSLSGSDYQFWKTASLVEQTEAFRISSVEMLLNVTQLPHPSSHKLKITSIDLLIFIDFNYNLFLFLGRYDRTFHM